MTIEFSPATEAEEIGRDLIPKHHGHLIGARVDFIFRSKPAKSKGQELLGKARKVSGLNAYLAGGNESDGSEEFFVIELSAQHWKELTESQKRALVDHELEHCVADEDDNGNWKLGIAPHDVEEFASVLKRHGLWRSDLRSFAQIAQQQLDLAGVDPETGEIIDS
jgi:hypothetical protein